MTTHTNALMQLAGSTCIWGLPMLQPPGASGIHHGDTPGNGVRPPHMAPTSIDLYLTSRIIAYRTRERDSRADRLIGKACTRIKSIDTRQTAGVHRYRSRWPSQACTGGWAEEWIGRRCDRDPRKDKREGAASKMEGQVGCCATKHGGGRAPTQWKSARPAPRAAQGRKLVPSATTHREGVRKVTRWRRRWVLE
jgi:hypothetical protein